MLDDKYVVDILHTSSDEQFKHEWTNWFIENLEKYNKYRCAEYMQVN